MTHSPFSVQFIEEKYLTDVNIYNLKQFYVLAQNPRITPVGWLRSLQLTVLNRPIELIGGAV